MIIAEQIGYSAYTAKRCDNASESSIEDIVTYVLNSGVNFNVITDICPSIEGAIGEYLDIVWHKVGGTVQ